MHLDLLDTVALAGLAASALDVKGKSARAVAAQPRILRRGEELTNVVKQSCVGRGIGARSSADGALVDVNDLVDIVNAAYAAALAGLDFGSVFLKSKGLVQYLVNEA